jgi:5-methylthioribose kinase
VSLRADFTREHPDFPLLRADDPGGVETFLRDRDWIEAGEPLRSCARAGEGNMNLTLRVRTDRRSFIVKQARAWVEKYDHIPAPLDRALVEQRFYERVASIPEVADRMPRLLAADASSRTLLLEDLGDAGDLTTLYSQGELFAEDAQTLGVYLRHLHGATRGTPDPALVNREMRRLNHLHIFEVPLDAGNGVGLDRYEPGLGEAAARLRADRSFCRRVAELGERYLADGSSLVHGDFFPGSWLRTAGGIRVIDPEFCFYGEPELDLGVAVAHFALSRQSFHIDDELIAAAVDPSEEVLVREAVVTRYAAVEIVRRLIGVAQLPIPPSDGFRANMLERARVAMREETLEAFRT